jgi:aryl-alcohol dehydrogenase-like predicted oxidoreductase
MGEGSNDKGSSRIHLTKALEDSLARLETDYVDVYFVHGFDANTPIEETLRTLNGFIESGKVRYIGCSNFAAWQLMKSLSIAEKLSLEGYVVYQGYYSLIGRDYEQEVERCRCRLNGMESTWLGSANRKNQEKRTHWRGSDQVRWR